MAFTRIQQVRMCAGPSKRAHRYIRTSQWIDKNHFWYTDYLYQASSTYSQNNHLVILLRISWISSNLAIFLYHNMIVLYYTSTFSIRTNKSFFLLIRFWLQNKLYIYLKFYLVGLYLLYWKFYLFLEMLPNSRWALIPIKILLYILFFLF